MRRILTVPVVLCGLALAAACSNSSDPGVPTAKSSAASASVSAGPDALAAYVKCIRDRGVSVAEPGPGADPMAWNRQQAEANPAFDAAAAACAHLAPAGTENGPQLPSLQELEQLRAYAVCMRAKGIDITDPDPTGNMLIPGYTTRAQEENDPTYKAAHEACKDKLPVERPK